ncbi:MAG TPA: hypothetical protein VIQ31_06465 [Phormidium sp.]
MADANKVVQAEELNDEALVEICRAAQVLACECPGYIARILRQVRAFHSYIDSCTDQFPQEAETHQWLTSKARQVEDILFRTMVELMQKENLIDESYTVSLDKISDRAREIVLKQIGYSW